MRERWKKQETGKMESANRQLEMRLANAKEWRCWRVVCARIRDIARNEQWHGVPYEETLRKYNYEFYRKRIKD